MTSFPLKTAAAKCPPPSIMIAHLVRAGKEVIDAVNWKKSLINMNIKPASPAPDQQTPLYRWPPNISE